MSLSLRPTTSKRAFARHFVEMLLAMVAGMAMLGALVTLLLVALGCSNLLDVHVDLHGIIMATNMSIGMGLWMRHRGHDREQIGQMTAAMYLPFVVLLVPYWTGLLGGSTYLAGAHVLMLPAMLGIMLRHRDVYAIDHGAHLTAHAPHRLHF